MLASERLIHIRKRLEEKKILNLKDITLELETSESTVRRDFEELEKQGFLHRIHGGAIRAKSRRLDTVELSMNEKSVINRASKKKVCFEASKLIKDGDCVFIDGGTSLMYMFDYLCNKDIKIVTHNMLNIHNLENIKAEIVVVGGKYVTNYKMNVGAIALEYMKKFSFDYSFIGCTGVDTAENTAYTIDTESAMVKQAAIESSLSKYLLIDKTKLDFKGFYKFISLNEFDAVFIDSYPENAEKLDNIIICSN